MSQELRDILNIYIPILFTSRLYQFWISLTSWLKHADLCSVSSECGLVQVPNPLRHLKTGIFQCFQVSRGRSFRHCTPGSPLRKVSDQRTSSWRHMEPGRIGPPYSLAICFSFVPQFQARLENMYLRNTRSTVDQS